MSEVIYALYIFVFMYCHLVRFLSSIKCNYEMNSCMTMSLFSIEACDSGSPQMHLIFNTP